MQVSGENRKMLNLKILMMWIKTTAYHDGNSHIITSVAKGGRT